MLRAQLGNLSSSQLTAQHQLTPPRTTAPELGAGSAQLQEVLNVPVSCQPQGTLNDLCFMQSNEELSRSSELEFDRHGHTTHFS